LLRACESSRASQGATGERFVVIAFSVFTVVSPKGRRVYHDARGDVTQKIELLCGFLLAHALAGEARAILRRRHAGLALEQRAEERDVVIADGGGDALHR